MSSRHGSRRRHVAGLALLAACVRPALASEPPPETVVLEWNADPSAGEHCATREEISASVEAVLERHAFETDPETAPWASVLRVQIHPPDAAGHYRASVTLLPPPSEATGAPPTTREIAAPAADCRSLDEPLALVVALMIDSGSAPPAEAAPAPPPEEPPRKKPPDEEPTGPILTAPRLAEDSRTSLALEVGLEAHLGLGILPSPALGAGLDVIVVPPAWVALRAHLASFLPQEEPAGPRASAQLALFYAGLDACPVLDPLGRVRLRPSVGAGVSSLRARPAGLEASWDVTLWTLQGEVGVAASYELGSGWLVMASVDAIVPFEPERLVFRRMDGSVAPLFRQGPVNGVAGLGVAWGFE